MAFQISNLSGKKNPLFVRTSTHLVACLRHYHFTLLSGFGKAGQDSEAKPATFFMLEVQPSSKQGVRELRFIVFFFVADGIGLKLL